MICLRKHCFQMVEIMPGLSIFTFCPILFLRYHADSIYYKCFIDACQGQSVRVHSFACLILGVQATSKWEGPDFLKPYCALVVVLVVGMWSDYSLRTRHYILYMHFYSWCSEKPCEVHIVAIYQIRKQGSRRLNNLP